MRLLDLAVLATSASAYYLGPRYPVPHDLSSNSSRVGVHWRNLTASLDALLAADTEDAPFLKNITFSIGIFSPHDDKAASSPALQYHSTGLDVADSPYGTNKVDGDSIYRVASVTKVVTVLAGLLNIKKSDWDRPLSDFFPNLKRDAGPSDAIQHVQWGEASVLSLASHLAGVAASVPGPSHEVSTMPEEVAAVWNFPPLSPDDPIAAVGCGVKDEEKIAECLANLDVYTASLDARPEVAGPWTTPSYSNNGFVLLGEVLRQITGKGVDMLYQESIFGPLGMASSSVATPTNETWGRHVLPPDAFAQQEFAGQIPATLISSGGVSSTIHDMAKFGSGILGHKLLSAARTQQWMKPKTHTDQLQVSMGTPWEIFRYLHADTGMVTDMYCKSGDSGSFSSWLCLFPEFDAGFTILGAAALEGAPLKRTTLIAQIADMVIDELMAGLTEQAAAEAEKNFAGTYESSVEGTNSSMVLAVNTTQGALPGLTIASFISNDVDITSSFEGQRLTPTTKSDDGTKMSFRALRPITPGTEGRLASLGELSWVTGAGLTWGNMDIDVFVFDVACGGAATAVSPVAWRDTYARQE